MDFKTNAKESGDVDAIAKKLQEKFPDNKLDIELENTYKVLHVHGLPEDNLHAAQVESAIKEAGFEGSWLTRGLENK
ncbi:MAG: hypothetical protein J1F16_08150 [Muribaculaceae bacterium]|nr:hypothetical protein [Muribaculaceae bacterium]